jgi:hypothetical protein
MRAPWPRVLEYVAWSLAWGAVGPAAGVTDHVWSLEEIAELAA